MLTHVFGAEFTSNSKPQTLSSLAKKTTVRVTNRIVPQLRRKAQFLPAIFATKHCLRNQQKRHARRTRHDEKTTVKIIAAALDEHTSDGGRGGKANKNTHTNREPPTNTSAEELSLLNRFNLI